MWYVRNRIRTVLEILLVICWLPKAFADFLGRSYHFCFCAFDFEAGPLQEKDQEENSKLDAICAILRNMTSLLHNRTFENVSDLIPDLQGLIMTMKNHTVMPAHL